MDRYTALPTADKTARRKQGLANYAYVRYADDFVVLCNGTKEHATAMREELQSFLATTLHLTLSLEKTKVTHLNDGFDFLGFTMKRSMGQRRYGTKVLISAKSISKHTTALRTACDDTTHENSFIMKIKALNRIITGWCRYFQYTSKTTLQFPKLEYRAFWLLAHWIGRKHKLAMPAVLRQYRTPLGLGTDDAQLCKHSSFASANRTYAKRFLKPNPYTMQEVTLEREEPPSDNPWLGYEKRPGWADIRLLAIERDNHTCRICKTVLAPSDCVVDHIRPYWMFKRPVEANRLTNVWTLCKKCHKSKTEMDRQMESRMQ